MSLMTTKVGKGTDRREIAAKASAEIRSHVAKLGAKLRRQAEGYIIKGSAIDSAHGKRSER